ncbi:MAG: filamentous hemagglutinin family protein [Prosthecobacter sp.]|jgi:filamentous hemagglutinin|uniref:filamentous haemagglutinin family protein n=1 Tax=Prosthecobacter sp. TaxID=1965333 RepID=UPI0019DC0756|nr:filamentous haemagglutinin family protein [Prosthecobacter sp.]MBE2285805.1 filamentous hemagglutinin family protein [Prosthecobacter sp.]
MKRSDLSSSLSRLPLFHVVLAHLLVLLMLLTPCTQAGDILRMGAAAGATPAAGGTPATPDAAAINTAAATAQARTNAQDMLARNTMALQAVTAMQEAARAAAAGSNNLGANPNFPGQTLPDVPNGLVTGGLELNGIPTGAASPQQSLENARTIVSIQQTQQQALLNWKTFNVGSNTAVRFDQSAGGEDVGNWIAFNTINDPSGNPTQILGSIEAQGQVYLINQNGIIFGGTSTVDTRTLVASSLPMNDNLITRGLLNNPDSQFLFSANAQPAGTKGPTPAYTPPSPPASGRIGNVTVQAGARITAPTSSANVGGRVALIGPNVTNEGTISTPDGQTILAAGMEVGFDAHSSDDPSLRGLDVYVGSVGTYGGTATNAGLIEAPRGSIVITGKNVNQNGFINSTTSAALNGRVDLLANYNAVPNINFSPTVPEFGKPFVYQSGVSTGIVSTGAGSVIQILPEYESALKVVGTELALKSQINMQGLGVHLGMDSVVYAPNADVALSAGVWDVILTLGLTNQDFAHASGQVYFDEGAVVSVAGSTAIAASIDQYILEVTLRAAELADSALQRNGILRGQTVTVDLREHGTRSDGTEWVGTPLADLTGYLGVIERNVGQLTVAGGTVSIAAGESVVMQAGAKVDVSGGYQDYDAGFVQTSRLIHEGNLVDIADARADIVYDGIYTPDSSSTDPRWATTSGSSSLFAAAGHHEAAHSVGANGGGIMLAAASMALDGSLVGNTVTGPQQIESAPTPSSLSIYFRAQQLSRAPLELPFYSPKPPELEFGASSTLPAAAAFALDGSGVPLALRAERQDAVVLSPTLLSTQGFGSLLVDNSDGNITVPAGFMLEAPLTGSVTLRGANVTIEGGIVAPGGTIDLIAYNVSPYTTAMLKAQGPGAVIPTVNPLRGRVTVGSSAILSTAGIIVDDRLGSTTRGLVPLDVLYQNTDGSSRYALTTQGGGISIDAFITEITTGGLLDVSGGFHIDENADVIYADAGSLTLKGGHDPAFTSLLGGHLSLGGTLTGLSGASGGNLTLQAPVIQFGGTAVHADALLLQPEFFSLGGFDSFHLTGLGIDVTSGGVESFLPGVLVSAGSSIRPQVLSLQAIVDPQGGPDSLTVSTLLKPEGYRPAASLLFEAPGVRDVITQVLKIRGRIETQSGSSIETDALGSVAFDGQTIELFGSVLAPGGSLSVSGDLHYPRDSDPTAGQVTVHLGTGSRLSTAGKVVLLADAFGLRTGHVYDGGSIVIEGNIVADSGSVLDVSGTTGVLDLLPPQAGTADVFTAGLYSAALFPGTGVTRPVQEAQPVATQIDSAGGSITLHGGDLLFSNATLQGGAGGATAAGGTVTVSSDRFILRGSDDNDKDLSLMVAQDMAMFTQPVFAGGQVLGSTLVNSSGGAIQSIGYFGMNSFTSGGFDSLNLKGNVQFVGPVDVAAAGYLKIADGGVLSADSLVRLEASYVSLGTPLAAPTRDEELLNPFFITTSVGLFASNFSPTHGGGRLEVTADLIETGFLSLQNIGQAALTARQELRGSGYFDIAGDLTLTAGQIYPVTASTFTITAYDYTVSGNLTRGSVTITSSGQTPELPLSGGGRLSIYASNIIQGGTLRAPLGTITLGWDGSGTAPKGLVTNTAVPVAQQITLQSGSTTSVSAIDPQTGAGVRIPYGILKDGTNWIDPTGFDITSIGAPDKSIKLGANSVVTEAGSSIDIRGGGELYGYRWVEGNGGTSDILDTDGSFAILPAYASSFAPFAPFASSGLFVENLGGDAGYANDTLSVGDRIFLKAAPGVAEGVYTLLPARYALLPGAMLVTPDSSGIITSAQVKPGGAVLASGYRFNSLNPDVTGRLYQQFEVAPLSVVKARAEYVDFTADVFLPAAQTALSLPVALTSKDAGYVLFDAQQSMQLLGSLTAGAAAGRGGRVDVSSPLDIVIAAPGAPAQPGKLVLDATLLNGWQAESLLIGGVRTQGAGSSSIAVRTTNLTLDNAGAPLTGRDIVLAASGTLTLADGAEIRQTEAQAAADAFLLSGNGTLVRVSGVASAQTSRSGVTASGLPQLVIGAEAVVSGVSITLDSSNATSLNPEAVLDADAKAVNLNSGRLSIQLDSPGALQPDAGLVLSGDILDALRLTESLSLLSYTALDLYGTGSFDSAGTLALSAGEIRGFNNGGGSVSITAADALLLSNSANGSVVGPVAALSGSLSLVAPTITIGQNALVVEQFASVALTASHGIAMQGSGSFRAQGDLSAVTPFFIASGNATQTFAAAGSLTLFRPGGAQNTPVTMGLGAQVTFEGASVFANTSILLPSGVISMRATNGNLVVDGLLDAGGATRTFFDTVRHTDAGQVSLTADAGDVMLSSDSIINLAAMAGGGDAGLLVLNAAGNLNLSGTLLGQAGTGGETASARIDVGTLASFDALNDILNAGSFTQSRDMRVRSGSVTINGVVNAHRFLLGVDQGSITVNGTVNASGQTGGRIDLIANGDVTLNSGSLLTVAGQEFDNAGKGGAIWIESGSQRNGVAGTGRVNIASGSTLNLSVAEKVAGGVDVIGSSAFRGQFSGKVHLRAPQNGTFTDLLVDPIAGTFIDPSSVEIEGYRLYSFNQANVIIRAGTTAITNETITTTTLNTDASSFFGAGNVNYNSMMSRLLAGNAALQSVSVLQPGMEIVNQGGNIVLGSTTSGAGADWNLATFRYGPNSAAGMLTLRAAGNLEFYNTLSDGFTPAGGNAVESMWVATLTARNNALPVNSQSWSYHLSAGSDLAAVNFREVMLMAGLGGSSGSLLLGKNAGQAVPSSAGVNSSPGADALTRLAINPDNGTNAATTSNRFQVIRTGTGDIEIAAGRDVQLLNPFATIYTAGTAVTSITSIFTASDFVRPIVTPSTNSFPAQGVLGAIQQLYAAQYSMAGGNVAVTAQQDIIHYTRDSGNNLVIDSQRQLPNNWLMRRGYVNADGDYGAIVVSAGGIRRINDAAASTTWWIDFSNFFDGVAALGGGNVDLNAGRDVQNVSAHAPTNARAARGSPGADSLLEHGGGDVTVTAGRNIDGGVYYVERGNAELSARNEITTNSTRSPSLGRLSPAPVIYAEQTWLPTTFFLGRGSLDISAGGDALIGPVANTMLLPQGLNNKHWYKTYFSTYSTDASVSVVSLGGDVTFRQSAVIPNAVAPEGMLNLWMKEVLLLTSNSASSYQPWLRLVETSVDPFATLSTLMPASLQATAFAGDVNVVGRLNLSPSPTGNLEIVASGSVNGLLPAGVSSTLVPGRQTTVWVSSSINLSDASPSALPAALTPFAYHSVFFDAAVPINNNAARLTDALFMQGLDLLFAESGSTAGTYASLQVKQGLHASGLLHANDARPVMVSASGGDISGLTLFSPKQTSILASRDITDVAFYLQNLRASDVSVVSSGRDIIAYNANSPSRTAAALSGNQPAFGETPKSGDIQISGPGTLQVLAGRDLNLGTGSNNADGTGVGITSIGNGRNPNLPFAGADIVVAAGLGGVASGLGSSNAKFADFIYAIQYAQGVLTGSPTAPKYELDGRRYLAELAAMLQSNGLRGLPTSILFTDGDPSAPVVTLNSGTISVGTPEPGATLLPNSINLDDPALTPAQRDQLALSLFFLALRDAGRDRNNPDSPDVNTYRAGYEAIQTMFTVPDLVSPGGDKEGIERLMDRDRPIDGYVFDGDITTQARDIRTKSGGSISILAPGGGLELAATLIGETLAPPGIITESGGNISIFADQDVSIGIARIFTLRGGDINIWSTVGDIAAGSSSKTVQSAPPTRVIIDPQSASVATDLAGLATGGGIGVLATVAGIAPGNVDLIAPIGAVDAGDAGIRATGNLNIAAAIVLNAANIVAGGSSAGTPTAAAAAAPSMSAVSSAGSSAAAATTATNAAQQNSQQQTASGTGDELPSVITVEVLGYGGGSGDDDERRRNRPGE